MEQSSQIVFDFRVVEILKMGSLNVQGANAEGTVVDIARIVLLRACWIVLSTRYLEVNNNRLMLRGP